VTEQVGERALDHWRHAVRFYDFWWQDKTDDLQFWLDLAQKSGGPVLEGMCGTGRVLIPLAEKGYRVVGVDRSRSMLDICGDKIDVLPPKVQERIELLHSPLETFRTRRRFALAIIPFNSFLLLPDDATMLQALRNVDAHLRPNGKLALSVFNPDLRRPERVLRHEDTRVDAETGDIITNIVSQTFDRKRQTTRVTLFYDVSRQGGPVSRSTTLLDLHYLFRPQLGALLRRAGFAVEGYFGDYDRRPFTKASDLQVVVARKRAR